jgi:hypothetical protein
MGPEAEGIAEALLNAPGFDASFERLLQAGVKDAAFVYAGDLAHRERHDQGIGRGPVRGSRLCVMGSSARAGFSSTLCFG